MSVYLPEHARNYIDDLDFMGSLQRMTSAVETGDIDLADLKAFINASAAGRPLQFQKTKPVSLRMLEEIRRQPNEEPRRIVYLGLHKGWWTYEDVERWEANSELLSTARKTSVSKGSYLTRNRRKPTKLSQLSDQFVPKLNLDVVCKHDLPDGAKACLSALMALAGKGDVVVTYTASLATMLGRTTRTIRNYFIALEACGLIQRKSGTAANTVCITISKSVRPEPYQEPKDITAYKLARKSNNPALREMAETVVAFSWSLYQASMRPSEGRKEISAFNLLYESKGDRSDQARLRNGVTTHSDFIPDMDYDRNEWTKRPGQRASKGWGQGHRHDVISALSPNHVQLVEKNLDCLR